jgi:hypothetical protein
VIVFVVPVSDNFHLKNPVDTKKARAEDQAETEAEAGYHIQFKTIGRTLNDFPAL